jgi:glycosyltransferase involved in cell wall biosynthesis
VNSTIDASPSLRATQHAAPTTAAGVRRIGKVVFVLHSHQAGGAERHLLELMRALSAYDIDCIYAGPLDGWLGQQVAMQGFRRMHIGYKGFFDIASLLRLVYLILREQPDIVHGHLTRGAFYSGIASRITTVPCVATAHSTNASKWFGLANRVIAVSAAVHTFLAGRGHAQKLRTVRHGVPDIARAPHAPREAMRIHLRLGDAPVLTMAARFTPAKGQDLVLHAMARLAHLQWTLVMAGALDTEYAWRIQQLATALGIEDRIRFVGHRDDMANIYACTDLLLAPSRREALSLTLLEAASFGIPVVASDVGGISEAIDDGVTGLLVPADDVEAIAAAVARLLEDAVLRRSMSTAARRRYESMFDVGRMTRATLDVYDELALWSSR